MWIHLLTILYTHGAVATITFWITLLVFATSNSYEKQSKVVDCIAMVGFAFMWPIAWSIFLIAMWIRYRKQKRIQVRDLMDKANKQETNAEHPSV